jgi:RNA polymerase sigma factor (sigma-70 family)
MDLQVFNEWRATGSVTLRNKLITDNIKIVHAVVRGFAPGEDYDDLVQDGTIGLIRALERFVPSLGAFYQFAKSHIRYSVQESIRLKHGVSTSRNKLTQDQASELLYGHLDRASIVEEGETYTETVTEQNNDRFESRRTIRRVVRDLTDTEIAALLSHQANAPIDTVARHLGCDFTTTREQVLEQVEALRARACKSINSPRKRVCFRCKYKTDCPHQ